MMMCTAGHVDHGKTRLVKLLTGCSTDRLKTEQERGLTIELGFAPCMLSGDICVGIVDVPGHEKFVRTMVSGVSGIDMTILVIAADDGVMPQTVEHMEIMQLLGVRRGVVALTKIDMVSAATVATRTEEIRAFLEGTCLEDAPICPVSSETFDGYGAFYDTLMQEVAELRHQPRGGIFRMPVERSFSQSGQGVVVTGIPVSGYLKTGDAVELVPGGQVGRVRGMQCFLRDRTEGHYGQCMALNIPDWGKTPPRRGQVIATPGTLRSARFLHVRLNTVRKLDHPLKHASPVKFHAGTTEASGKCFLLEQKSVGGGSSALATIALMQPEAVAIGDRFILRRPSPAATLAGGEILDVSSDKTRPNKARTLEALRNREAFFTDQSVSGPDAVIARVEFALLTAPRATVDMQDLVWATLLLPDELQDGLTGLVDAGRALHLGRDEYMHSDCFDRCLADTEEKVRQRANEAGGELSQPELQSGSNWSNGLWSRIWTALATDDVITIREGRVVVRSAIPDLSEAEAEIARQLEELYDRTGFHSPHPSAVADDLGLKADDVTPVFDRLLVAGRLVRLSANVVLSIKHLREAQALVIDIATTQGRVDSGRFKLEIESSRKYALAILDFLDAHNITVRSADNSRLLRSGYAKHLF